MSTLGEIREAIARAIDNGTAMNLYTYPRVEELVDFPAVIVEPAGWDPEQSFGQTVRWDFNVFVLTSYNANAAWGQDDLDQLVDSFGPNSIARILEPEDALGLGDSEAHTYAVRGYGGSHEYLKTPHIGAVLKVWVVTERKE